MKEEIKRVDVKLQCTVIKHWNTFETAEVNTVRAKNEKKKISKSWTLENPEMDFEEMDIEYGGKRSRNISPFNGTH